MEITIPVDYLWYGGYAIGAILIAAFLYKIRKGLCEFAPLIIFLIFIGSVPIGFGYAYYNCPARDFRIWEIINKADKFGPKAKEALREANEDGMITEPEANKIDAEDIKDKIDECLTK